MEKTKKTFAIECLRLLVALVRLAIEIAKAMHG